ncbi:alpha/beta-hydrolase [Schizopora paradoxa]|uniref:Alpha/beta-hydrolase n=1 Tax=Schizopora paradoxa TaxID=27342 RepID=A0A0H2SBK7_9AGAM|nr:alpha/beta-hydrolase [Schizopora paradoxa]
MPRTSLPDDDTKLSPFSISTHTYKVTDGHEILADVLIPKKLLELGSDSEEWKKGRPVMVRFHGGWLVGGHRGFPTYIPLWLYSSGYHNNAIIVAPDYRLLPEATVVELLDDLDDFWKWLGTEFPSVVREQSRIASGSDKELEVDLDRVVVQGESAGGYCAVQVALSHFKPPTSGTPQNTPHIRALVAIYPMLDFRASHWSEAYEKHIMGNPQYPESIIDDHLKAIKASATKPVLSAAPLGPGAPRNSLPYAYIQHGRFLELLGPERDPSPGNRIIHAEDRILDGAKLPPALFVQGTEDSGVPVGGTDNFISLLREHDAIVRPEGLTDSKDWDSLMYARVPGEHGFDSNIGPNDTAWAKDGLDFIEKIWLELD